jgi:pimeloyl-ACP methyl ester carboxylesterase
MPSRLLTRIAGPALALLTVTAGIAGCTAEATPTADDALVQGIPGFEDVYTQTLEWGACSPLAPKAEAAFAKSGRSADDRRCTHLSAPLDWDDPDSTERVQLTMVRYPATGTEKLGSLLVNPGGPGGEAQSLAGRLVAEPRFDKISAAYDVIGLDPRGMGESATLDCTADDSTKPDAILFAECLRDNPVTHHMGTSSVAKDMDVVRYLMGDAKLNYLGYSYGTVLGATYSTLFPGLVGRVVLDSAIDATWAGPINGFDQYEAILRASGELGASCATTNTTSFPCAWTDRAGLDALLAQLEETPWVASDGTEVGDVFLNGYVTTTNYWIGEPRAHRLDLLAGAAAGDQASIDEIAADHSSSTVGLAGSIVRCFSEPVHPDVIAFYDHVLEVTGDPKVAADMLGTPGSTCSLLSEAGTDISDTFDASGSAPILVIGVTGDHATPYDKSVSLVGQLKTAGLLTLEAHQHAASYRNSGCIDALVDAYLLEDEMPPADTVCQLD